VKYDIVLADPPWYYSGSPYKMGAAGKEYPLMLDDEIYSLDVQERMNKNSILFLWATCPKLHVAIEAIERWNLWYRGVAFVWVKTKQDGTPIGAQGVRPSITKPLTELVLVASPMKSGRPLPLASESIRQTIFAPKGRHSEKPEAVQDAIEVMYPNATKLEMFARRVRPGWDAWGNEV
jgi:N6-adenosine-specific RNA methylase IME4